MDLGLAGSVFVIGGGSRGIGFATAACLVDEGAHVVLAARDPQRLAEASAALGPSAVGVAVDLADAGSADTLVAVAVDRFGRLDGALCNVGGPARIGAGAMDDAAWTTAFASVFLAPVRLARVVAEHLRGEQGEGGSLCFVLSMSARTPLPQMAASNALRPGLAHHVKDLADEIGPPPRSVRVNAVAPGGINGPRTDELHQEPGHRRRVEERVPLRRFGEMPEVAAVTAFLLSPAASYVTGTLVGVDGGAARSV